MQRPCPGLGRLDDLAHQETYRTTPLDSEVSKMAEFLKDKKICLLLPVVPVLFEPFLDSVDAQLTKPCNKRKRKLRAFKAQHRRFTATKQTLVIKPASPTSHAVKRHLDNDR